MSLAQATLDEILDDLCSRFIINVPEEELQSVERICFQIEQAHWFYEDFVREQNPQLPSFNLKNFSKKIFQHCPLLSQWSNDHERAFADFMQYKIRVPVCGAIILNEKLDKCLLVKGWSSRSSWGFPKGKINKDESEDSCAIREVYEETGFDISPYLVETEYIEMTLKEQRIRLYLVEGVPEKTEFCPQTRKEISKIAWHKLSELPTWRPDSAAKGMNGGAIPSGACGNNRYGGGGGSGAKSDTEGRTVRQSIIKQNRSNFFLVVPFVGKLRQWVSSRKKAKRKTGEGYTSDLNNHKPLDQTPVMHNSHVDPAVISSIPMIGGRESGMSQGADASNMLKSMLGIAERPTTAGPVGKSDALKSLLGISSNHVSQPQQQQPQQPQQYQPPVSTPPTATALSNLSSTINYRSSSLSYPVSPPFPQRPATATTFRSSHMLPGGIPLPARSSLPPASNIPRHESPVPVWPPVHAKMHSTAPTVYPANQTNAPISTRQSSLLHTLLQSPSKAQPTIPVNTALDAASQQARRHSLLNILQHGAQPHPHPAPTPPIPPPHGQPLRPWSSMSRGNGQDGPHALLKARRETLLQTLRGNGA
ncbi:uncharacterized protein VTP21DRAFT_7677 [Calcarisporiella thermophila]|uniref:uncharacterized protein n=1 Tax=Calcarisporiella thermophila TaxID=911321 RepID=UPI0037447F31